MKILYHHPIHSYYKDKFTGGSNPPDCGSMDGKFLFSMADALIEGEAAEALQKSNPKGLTGLALVNEMYRRAGLDAPFVNSGKDLSISTLRSSLFQQEQNKIWKLNPNSPYYKLVAPTLYGGRKYFTPQQYTATSKANSDRTRLPRVQDVVVGDVLVVKFLSSEAMYLYVGGDHFLNLGKATLDEDTYTSSVRLMRMMSAGQYFAVIRPSFGWK